MRIKIFESLDGGAAAPDLGIPETYNATTPEFKELYDQRGVYYIYSSEGAKKPIYIGRSKSNLGKTIMRHYQNWRRARERKYTEDDPRKMANLWVEVNLMPNADETEIFNAEGDAIDKYKPRLNMIKALKKTKDDLQHYKTKTAELQKQWDEYLARKAAEEEEAARAITEMEAEEMETERARAIAQAEDEEKEQRQAQETERRKKAEAERKERARREAMKAAGVQDFSEL